MWNATLRQGKKSRIVKKQTNLCIGVCDLLTLSIALEWIKQEIVSFYLITTFYENEHKEVIYVNNKMETR